MTVMTRCMAADRRQAGTAVDKYVWKQAGRKGGRAAAESSHSYRQ